VTRDGVDVSWYRNCKFPVDAFVIDCEEDFFGYYDYNLRYGVVQHADHYKVPGKKRFTWGTSEDGLFWAPVLSDKGIPYIELQTGKYRTQGIVGSIDPHFYDEWREWWYPIAAIEGISFANKDATVHLKVEPLGDGLFEVFVGVYATASFPESTVIVNLGEETLEEKVDLSPAKPLREDVQVEEQQRPRQRCWIRRVERWYPGMVGSTGRRSTRRCTIDRGSRRLARGRGGAPRSSSSTGSWKSGWVVRCSPSSSTSKLSKPTLVSPGL
jgi:hypothetical protein